MASIEILENTLLKLLVRRGTNEDRKNITLDEGELGYASDTTRLFIGDGTTVGGNLVGNKFLGSRPDITIETGEINDLAFDNDNNTLQRIKQNNGSSVNDWEIISNLISAGNESIVIDSVQRATVGTLSAGNFSTDALGNSIEIDTSNRIALSSSINIDEITQRTVDATSYLTIPSKLKISSINYDFPSQAAASNNSVLLSDVNNQLSWGLPTVVSSTVPTTTANQIPAGTVVPYITAAEYVPYGWLKCDGSEVLGSDYPDLSGVIGTTYGGTVSTFNLPDFTNGTLYGTNVNDPYNSTIVPISSGGNNSLSAFGTTFIIKAIEDNVQAPTIKFTTPLSATLNGVGITDTATEFLSGTIEVGLSGYKEDNAVYKSIFLDEPVEIWNNKMTNGMASWEEVLLSDYGIPSNAKIIYGVASPAQSGGGGDNQRTFVWSSHDNSQTPDVSDKKVLLSMLYGTNRGNIGGYTQFTTRVDKANNKIYLARQERNKNIIVSVHGYGI